MIAVITGAGSGIGYEMSRMRLMDYGYDLILTGRNIDRLEDARQKLTLLWAVPISTPAVSVGTTKRMPLSSTPVPQKSLTGSST